MFFEFFKLELRSAFRSPMLYVFFFLIMLASFGAVGSENVQIGGAVGNIHKNSPHVLTNFTLVLGVFGLLFAAAFFNNAALRDHNNQFNEIMFHLPVRKSGYFMGRFAGALLLSTIPMLGVFPGAWLGALIGPLAGWIEPERIGPFFAETIYSNYFIFILPNMFIAGSIIFLLAHRFKNTIISFVGALGIFVGYLMSLTLLTDIENENTAALVDVFGVGTYSVFSKYYTPAEKNSLSPMLEGVILYNRLLWISVGLVISLLSYYLFSFRERLRYNRLLARKEKMETAPVISDSTPKVKALFGPGTNWLQFRSFFKANFLSIYKSIVFRIVAIFGLLLLFNSLLQGYEYFGLQSYPVTYKVIEDISGSTGLFMLIVVVFFSGELVWRDRMSQIHEVVNATPHNSFVSVFAKVASLVSVAILLQFVFIAMGILSQLFRGYTQVEVSVYLIHFLVDDLPGYIIMAALFVLIQTLLNNRYIGYFVGILFITVWSIILSVVHWSSNMLIPGGSPGITYSDMNGFGPGFTGTLWFDAYWIAFALVLIFLAGLFWPRSVVSGFREKVKMARANFSPSAKRTLALFGGLWFAIAAIVYYNTIILNPYKSSKQYELIAVDYEKKYKKYEHANLPVLTDIYYEIDLFPYNCKAELRCKARYENTSDSSIDTLYFNLNENWENDIEIPGAELVLDDAELGFRIYALHPGMAPGERMEIKYRTAYAAKGFANSVVNTAIVENGTFLNNYTILPTMGYFENLELQDKNKRKKYDLPERKRMPTLEYPCGHACMSNYISGNKAHLVNLESVISTASDQIAVAPGSLIREWTEGDRRYFHYKLEQPSLNFYSFLSARYEVAREKHGEIDIEIYYHPSHHVNVPRMIDVVRRSFAYFENHFGPYYHRQARIVEFPRYSSFAQAFPGTMPYSESIGFIINLENENDNNIVDAVIAHEMAHQWWAHQEVPADMQGATMISESFAEYSSLMVMKHDLKGDDMKMKNFLKYNYNRYLRGRATELEKEVPLYKVENQDYIHYGKGSVIMYALQDYLSEDSVNKSMRTFLNEYRYSGPPYPNSLDYMRHLDPLVPDSLKQLVDDWVKHITLYDLRLKNATARKLPDGMYEVSMDVESMKFYADSLGSETEAPFNEWIDIGVYYNSDEKRLSAWKRMRINGKENTITMVVDSLPAKAAIDPRRMLVERVISDNVKPVKAPA